MSGKCPCEECISLAICYNRNRIRCEILYNFLCATRKDYSGRLIYVDRNQINIRLTEKVFNKSFHGSNINRMSTSWGPTTNIMIYGDDEFAKKYGLPIKVVIQPEGESLVGSHVVQA